MCIPRCYTSRTITNEAPKREARLFAALRRVVSRWYVAAVLMAALGLAVGYASFFYVFSERPQVGVIDVPFTFLDQSTASSIGAMLDYADRTDSIKAVVLKLEYAGRERSVQRATVPEGAQAEGEEAGGGRRRRP